jgi:hypothetical protein
VKWNPANQYKDFVGSLRTERTVRVHRVVGMSWLTEPLLASEEANCSMELISSLQNTASIYSQLDATSTDFNVTMCHI